MSGYSSLAFLSIAMAAAWGYLTGKRTRDRLAHLEEELGSMKQGKFCQNL